MVHVQFIPQLHENIFIFMLPCHLGGTIIAEETMPLLREKVLEKLNINIDIYLN